MQHIFKSMGSKGEVVLPKRIRDKYGFGPKSRLRIIERKDGPQLVSANVDFRKFAGMLSKDGVDLEKLDELALEIMYGDD